MPSSVQMAYRSVPSRSRTAAPIASAHGACTRPPNGVSTQHPPIAQLVAEALDDHRAVAGHRTVISFCSAR